MIISNIYMYYYVAVNMQYTIYNSKRSKGVSAGYMTTILHSEPRHAMGVSACCKKVLMLCHPVGFTPAKHRTLLKISQKLWEYFGSLGSTPGDLQDFTQ